MRVSTPALLVERRFIGSVAKGITSCRLHASLDVPSGRERAAEGHGGYLGGVLGWGFFLFGPWGCDEGDPT